MVRLLELGARTEYAVRTMAILATKGEGAVETVKNLAAEAEVSVHFLYSIFDLLVRGRLINAHKGRVRGFSLARPADQISFLDIVRAVEGPIEKAQCLLDKRDICRPEKPCAAHASWSRMRERVEQELAACTLDKMSEQNPPWERLKEA